jgi:hypothetical protein
MGTREDDRYDYMMECGAWDRANDRIKELERERDALEERVKELEMMLASAVVYGGPIREVLGEEARE